MPIYYSDKIEENNIRLGHKLRQAEENEKRIENLTHALNHAIAMMEISRDRYGDPAKLFDLEYYRRVASGRE